MHRVLIRGVGYVGKTEHILLSLHKSTAFVQLCLFISFVADCIQKVLLAFFAHSIFPSTCFCTSLIFLICVRSLWAYLILAFPHLFFFPICKSNCVSLFTGSSSHHNSRVRICWQGTVRRGLWRRSAENWPEEMHCRVRKLEEPTRGAMWVLKFTYL